MAANNYIGRQVSVNNGSGQIVTGTVSAIDTSGSSPNLIINGIEYPISNLQGIQPPSRRPPRRPAADPAHALQQQSQNQNNMSLIGTLTSGVSAMESFEQGLSVIGNNIANVNTTAFKSGSASYADSFSNILQSSTPAPARAAAPTPTRSRSAPASASPASARTTPGLAHLHRRPERPRGLRQRLLHREGPLGRRHLRHPRRQLHDRLERLPGDEPGLPRAGPDRRLDGSAPATVGDIKLGTPPTGTQLQSYTIDGSGNLTEDYSDSSTVTTNQILLQNFQNPERAHERRRQPLLEHGRGPAGQRLDSRSPPRRTPPARTATAPCSPAPSSSPTSTSRPSSRT
jgi:hypothetical protein